MTLCVFADCPHEGTLVPIVEMQSAPKMPVASCVLNGTVCESCRARVVQPVDLVGPIMLMEIEAALAVAADFGGVADPDLTRIVFVLEGQMLTPMAALVEG